MHTIIYNFSKNQSAPVKLISDHSRLSDRDVLHVVSETVIWSLAVSLCHNNSFPFSKCLERSWIFESFDSPDLQEVCQNKSCSVNAMLCVSNRFVFPAHVRDKGTKNYVIENSKKRVLADPLTLDMSGIETHDKEIRNGYVYCKRASVTV